MLQTVIDIVKGAAAVMTAGDFTVHYKDNPDNLVTTKDVAVEAYIKSALSAAIPDLGFIGEEEDFAADALTHRYTAVVDPIDGTMNFTRQMNLSVVSVALLRDGAPYIGVVCNPYTNELFYAERGKGAFLNGKPIHVSDRPLREACYFTAWSLYKKEYAPPCFDIAREIYADTGDIRRLGVCALELCYLAAGRGELYFEIRVFPWDLPPRKSSSPRRAGTSALSAVHGRATTVRSPSSAQTAAKTSPTLSKRSSNMCPSSPMTTERNASETEIRELPPDR